MTVLSASITKSSCAIFVEQVRKALEEPSADRATEILVSATLDRISDLIRENYPRGYPFTLLSGKAVAPRPRLAKMGGRYMGVYNKFHHTIRVSTAGEFDVTAADFVQHELEKDLECFSHLITVLRDRAAITVEIDHCDHGVEYMSNTKELNAMLSQLPHTIIHRRMLEARESEAVYTVTEKIADLQRELSEAYAELGMATARKALSSMPELLEEFEEIARVN